MVRPCRTIMGNLHPGRTAFLSSISPAWWHGQRSLHLAVGGLSGQQRPDRPGRGPGTALGLLVGQGAPRAPSSPAAATTTVLVWSRSRSSQRVCSASPSLSGYACQRAGRLRRLLPGRAHCELTDEVRLQDRALARMSSAVMTSASGATQRAMSAAKVPCPASRGGSLHPRRRGRAATAGSI